MLEQETVVTRRPEEQPFLFMGTKAPETPEQIAGLDAVFEAAARVKPQLDDLTSENADHFPGANPIIPPELKRRARTLAKVRNDYRGDATKLKDLARTTIETQNLAQAKAVVAEIERRPGCAPRANSSKKPRRWLPGRPLQPRYRRPYRRAAGPRPRDSHHQAPPPPRLQHRAGA